MLDRGRVFVMRRFLDRKRVLDMRRVLNRRRVLDWRKVLDRRRVSNVCCFMTVLVHPQVTLCS